MAVTCFYHEEYEAEAFCASCGRTICKECTTLFLNLSSCPRCTEAVHALAYPTEDVVAPVTEIFSPADSLFFSKIAANPSNPLNRLELDPSALEGAREGMEELGPLVQAEPVAEPTAEAIAVENESIRYLTSVASGMIMGAVFSLAIFKIQMHVHVDLSLFYIVVGYVVARTVKSIYGKNSIELAASSVVVMLIGLLFSYIAYAQDLLSVQMKNNPGIPSLSLFQEFGNVLVTRPVMHWVFIVAGLIVCWFTITVRPKGRNASPESAESLPDSIPPTDDSLQT